MGDAMSYDERIDDRTVVVTPPTEGVAELISKECRAVEKMLLEKNRNYGNSALDPVRIFSKASTIEQIRVRIDDKLSRLYRGKKADEDVVLDLIGYLILLRVQEKKNVA